tara:strand:+ start:570 stop:722 length:153 start_codon:yes stop_codon:yes gene_type:complete
MKHKCNECQGTGLLSGKEAWVIHPEGVEEFIYTVDHPCYKCNAEGYIENE